ncbi:HvfC/BufC N-terminal domain-containing protein [Piscinibacter gummiphilus]|uniref:Uncharacterized protein n=1 Tax=Piscinibacter gummiphilus TaxID=946333 RepID=A0A1W6L2K3_9BURK|nr:DNA-binding domain-containing protein [Piscinibacter gummiphilus]ARN18447.1 hypothetical protein A4W93_00115 [Piscinibacter gummiphilus]ATU63076.1 DUF2063 domain-containing protein [Piscinibacter gummiphilus]GLS95383.1 DUF2063 domain-containing protein [Piscinibacter gummiphilus]
MTHAAFHQGFVKTLQGATGDPAMAVYRNTVVKGCIDALEANFPAVVRLVGRDWFRSVAALYVAEEPPRDPRLFAYGGGFPAFLGRFGPAADLPYLEGVASLDQLWVESFAAADADALRADALVGLAPDALGGCRLVPHPAARWSWHPRLPIATLWSHNREWGVDTDLGDIAWQGEGVLLTRPALDVQWCGLTAGGVALLTACAKGHALADAASAALAEEPDCDLAATLALLLEQGAFAAASLSSRGLEP